MTNVAPMIAAMAAAAERRVIEQLRGKGATSHQTAAAFSPAQSGDQRYLEGLLDRGVVVEAAPGRYWVNERTLRARGGSGKAVLLAAVVAALLLLGVTIVLLEG